MKKILATALLTVITAVSAIMPCAAATNPQLEAAIVAGVKAGNDSIDISSYNVSVDDAMNAFKHLYLTNPDMYPVTNKVSCKYSGVTATSVNINYAISNDERAKVEAEINKVVASAAGAATDYDKAKAVHDYLIKNYKTGTQGFSAYALLIGGEAVCSGYTLTFKAAMDRLGIPCEVATSTVMNHEWAMVKLDGSWYHCDVFWDKNTSDANGGAPCYDNFAKSDMMITLLGHTGWTVNNNIKATDTKFDTVG
jgi:transglutaminase/protease-like cytokinesis protein 3